MPGFVWFFVIVVAVPVLASVGADMFRRWLKLKEKQLDHAASMAADRAATQAAQIERLEQRMRVLERIATDRSNELAEQIEDLRSDSVN